jgi:hypothetical protein
LDGNTPVPPWPFEKEVDLENAITEIRSDLFGASRGYLEIKKLIGQAGKTQNIPDAYLFDFSSPKKPVLYLVEVELAKHDPRLRTKQPTPSGTSDRLAR